MTNREPGKSPIPASELGEVRWEMAEMKADLQSRIMDVELRLAWLRVYGICAAGLALLMIISIVKKLSH